MKPTFEGRDISDMTVEEISHALNFLRPFEEKSYNLQSLILELIRELDKKNFKKEYKTEEEQMSNESPHLENQIVALVEKIHRKNIQELHEKVERLAQKQSNDSISQMMQLNELSQNIINIQNILLQQSTSETETGICTHVHGEFLPGSMMGKMFENLFRLSGDLLLPDRRWYLYKEVYRDMKEIADRHNQLHTENNDLRYKYER